jgi:hypothetical protein
MAQQVDCLDEFRASMDHSDTWPCNLSTDEANTGAILVHRRELEAKAEYTFRDKTEIHILELKGAANAANSGMFVAPNVLVYTNLIVASTRTVSDDGIDSLLEVPANAPALQESTTRCRFM